jgi:hypothetical protein
MGCLEQGVPVTPHVAIALVIGKDKEDVGLWIGGGLQRNRKSQGDKQCESVFHYALLRMLIGYYSRIEHFAVQRVSISESRMT